MDGRRQRFCQSSRGARERRREEGGPHRCDHRRLQQAHRFFAQQAQRSACRRPVELLLRLRCCRCECGCPSRRAAAGAMPADAGPKCSLQARARVERQRQASARALTMLGGRTDRANSVPSRFAALSFAARSLGLKRSRCACLGAPELFSSQRTVRRVPRQKLVQGRKRYR